MKSKIANYVEAIQILQEIQTGQITQEQVMDIVLKIAELYPAALVNAREATIDGVERMIISYLRQGQKIMAIKYYRQETGYGLKEAKDHVDDIAQRMGF